jgi:hypothetical protein
MLTCSQQSSLLEKQTQLLAHQKEAEIVQDNLRELAVLTLEQAADAKAESEKNRALSERTLREVRQSNTAIHQVKREVNKQPLPNAPPPPPAPPPAARKPDTLLERFFGGN